MLDLESGRPTNPIYLYRIRESQGISLQLTYGPQLGGKEAICIPLSLLPKFGTRAHSLVN